MGADKKRGLGYFFFYEHHNAGILDTSICNESADKICKSLNDFKSCGFWYCNSCFGRHINSDNKCNKRLLEEEEQLETRNQQVDIAHDDAISWGNQVKKRQLLHTKYLKIANNN